MAVVIGRTSGPYLGADPGGFVVVRGRAGGSVMSVQAGGIDVSRTKAHGRAKWAVRCGGGRETRTLNA